jgi:hypothetical protein
MAMAQRKAPALSPIGYMQGTHGSQPLMREANRRQNAGTAQEKRQPRPQRPSHNGQGSGHQTPPQIDPSAPGPRAG